MNAPLTAYTEYLGQYADFLDTMCEQAGERYHALASFDAARLNHAMAALQSNVMQLEQMETKRIQMAQEAGYPDLTFREMLGQVPEEARSALEPLFRRIELAAANVKFMNEKAMDFAKENLSTLAPGMMGETQNLYVPPAFAKMQKSTETPTVFEAKF